MSAVALLDELLAGFAALPARGAVTTPAPANSANSANREQPSGFMAEPGQCEGLRNLANPGATADAGDFDSQTFAAVRNLQSDSESKQRHELSQDSQDSQGLSSNSQPRACPGCAHCSPHGTCAEPDPAGLATSLGMALSPAGHGATGPARSSPAPVPAFAVRADLAMCRNDADRCHAGGWDDAEIARFVARRNRLMRWGWGQSKAELLAERLTLRDRDSDDRVICCECRHCRQGRCDNYGAAGLQMPEVARGLATTLHRCLGFSPSELST